MARDLTELDDTRTADNGPENADIDSKDALIDRRSYLKAAGVASVAAAGLAATGSAAASPDDYEVIEVGAGETWEYHLDDGEVFENYLIDITARNAEAELWARGNDWEVRNVGFRGQWDTTRRGNFINAMVPNASSTGLIENVYIGDGASTTNYPNSPNGVFVPRPHAGELTIRNLHVQHLADNAVYGSPPGQSGGGDGAVIIEDSYCRDIQPAGWRVGGSGSRIVNSVAVNAHRGIWNRFSEIDVIDCDITRSRLNDIEVRQGRVSGNRPTVNAQNSYWGTSHTVDGPVNGSPSNRSPRTRPEEVEGVPLSAEEAAAGTSSSSPSEPERPDDGDEQEVQEEELTIEDVWNDDEPNHVELRGGSGAEVAEYRIAGYGAAEAGENADTNPDDPYRDAVENGGEAFEIAGYLGGFVDDFYLEGYVEDVETTVDLTAAVNGKEFDLADLEGVGTEPDIDEDDGLSTDDGETDEDDGDDESSTFSVRFFGRFIRIWTR